MAWQTPKTDWKSADSVRDSDFNRIEGDLLYLYNTSAVRADLTVYVSASGNDATGNGTSAAPYRTIMHALSTIPNNLNGRTAMIDIATGDYPENIVVKGFTGGRLVFYGAYGRTMTIKSLEVDGSILEVRTIDTRATAGGITVINGGTLLCSGSVSVSGSMRGLHVLNCSSCRIYAQLTVDASSAAAVHASGASMIYVLSLAGSDNENAFIAEEGSIVSYGNTNISVNVAGFITRSGGRIYTGGA